MRRSRLAAAALLLGIGLGGFLDGIVFHQILQWHSMLSSRVPPETVAALHTNMRADGWFHAFTWLVTVAGIVALWRSYRAPGRLPSGRGFMGWMLMGWGGFNLVEGSINHFVLELHHVRDLPLHVPIYDWIFLCVGGIAFFLIGLVLRDGPEPAPLSNVERRSGIDRRSGAAY